MKVRQPCKEDEADGRDEGGFFKLVEVEPLPAKLTRRMERCAGCRDSFYNHRTNVSGNTCWFLRDDKYFRRRGKPGCWHT